jgi:transposase-like protein
MANKLSVDEKVSAIGMLCEGSSIRSIERITGIHRDTVMAFEWAKVAKQ